MPARRWSKPCRSTLAALFAVAPVLLFSVRAARAAQDRPAAEPAAPLILSSGLTITPGLSATEYYDLAVAKLRRGRNFERAILELREAVKQEPDNRAYQIAFGCALASRAAALGNAASHLSEFAMDQAKFKMRLGVWETVQKDRSSPLYRKPLPPVLRTKDDNKQFTLTADEATKQFAPLALAAVAAWDRAASLAKTDAERAEAQWYRGWGLFLLRGFGKPVGVDKIKDFPAFSDVAKAFEAATEAAPNDARYWQSLGDSFLDYDCDPKTTVPNVPNKKEHLQSGLKAGLDAYQRAVRLDKRNTLLWYRLYELWRQDTLMRADGLFHSQEDAQQSESALRQAARLDAGNAFPVYRLAGLRLRETTYNLFQEELGKVVDANTPLPPREQTTARVLAALTDKERAKAREAINMIEQGNRAPRYTLPIYRPAVPPLLAAAWNFRRHTWLRETWWDFSVWDTVTNITCDFAHVTVQEGRGDEAVRATQALIRMGARLSQDVSDKMRPGDSILVNAWLGGMIAGLRGYETQADVYETLGDTGRAAEARKAMEVLRTLNKERQEAVYAEDGYGDY